MAEALFLFDGSDIDAARQAHARGETVIAFSEAAAQRLTESTVSFSRAIESLGDDPEMPLYRAAADWTQAFGTRAVANGETLKEALRYRGTTLWWWAELYLHHNTEAARRVRFLETVARVMEKHGAKAVRTHGLSFDQNLLVERLARAHHVSAVRGEDSNHQGPAVRSALTSGLLEASKMVATAAKSTALSDDRLVPRAVVFVSHAAFWKTRVGKDGAEESYEHYLDDLLTESKRRGLPMVTLGVGPQTTFRTRSLGDKWRERLSLPRDERYVHVNRFVTPRLAASALKALGNAMSLRNRFQNAASLKDAFSWRGVAFDDLSAEDLGRTLLHQVPWAARCLLEFDAAFRSLDPRLVCLYAESSGLGRAAIEAARALNVKTLGVQHGILYPNYYSYERSATDLKLGTPITDTTSMYGDDGVRMLEATFGYPKGRVVATGSPRYDSLAAEIGRVNRDERRKELGIEPSEKLVVLASRYTGIRDTHKASGPVFASLLSALSQIKGARLFVKPHPAEPRDAYDRDIAAAPLGDRVRVTADHSLTDLLPAADLLITVESLSATEALVAGVPVVVLRHPSNLRDLVTSKAAFGVPDGADPGPVIETLLFDQDARAAWRKSRDAFIEDVAKGADGRSLERLMELVSRMAGLD